MRGASILSFLFLCGAVVPGQVVHIDDANAVSPGAYATPFVPGSASTTLQVYTAAQLRARGVCGGARLTDLAIVAAVNSGNFFAPVARFLIGHLSVSPPVPGAWTTHLASPATVHDLGMGAYGFVYVADAWSSLPGVAAAGFQWDGARDVGIFISTSVGVTGGFYARHAPGNLLHRIAAFNPTTQPPTTVGNFAMKVRMTFVPGPATHQVNQPRASFDVDGVQGQPCAPASLTKCAGAPGVLNFGSTLAGGWELLIASVPLAVPGAGAMILAPSGQILNVDLAAPVLVALNGFTFPPFPGGFSFPFTTPAAGSLSAQMAVLDPASPNLVALSAGANLGVVAAAPVPGPAAAGLYTDVALGALPLCGPASIPLYGTSYTRIGVSAAGRVTFGANSALATPGIGWATLAPAMAGNWCDLDPAAGGSITISAVSLTVLRVDWVNVPYTGWPATANTFGIEFDAAAGTVRLDNLGGIQVHPGTASAWVGIAPGNGGTNNGATAFFPAGAGTTTNATRILYAFGPAGAQTTGLSSILFIPNAAGNYDWVSF